MCALSQTQWILGYYIPKHNFIEGSSKIRVYLTFVLPYFLNVFDKLQKEILHKSSYSNYDSDFINENSQWLTHSMGPLILWPNMKPYLTMLLLSPTDYSLHYSLQYDSRVRSYRYLWKCGAWCESPASPGDVDLWW